MITQFLAAASTPQTQQAENDNGFLVLVGIVAVLALSYWISLHIHPYTKCGVCKGAGRSRGNLFSHSFGLCRRCGGTGRKSRLGVRLFIRNS